MNATPDEPDGPTEPDAGALLTVSDLTVRHGGLVALQDVSLAVQRNEVAGLIGPNGAGKTTFIDTVSGFTASASGAVHFEGTPIDALAPHERARRGLARTFQSLELFDDLTVRENLIVAAEPVRRFGLLGDLFRHRPASGDRADELLSELGLGAHAHRRPTELSNGQRHLVAIGRALAPGPSLVLLDEPAAGLDEDESDELGAALAGLPASGVGVLLVDHDMSIVLGVCDTVHVLDFGGLIASGPPEQIRSDPQVVSAYLGTTGHRT